MKKKAALALTLCAALLAGCGQKEVEEEKKTRSVEVMTVGKSAIADEFTYTGRAAAAKTVAVIPTVPGKVMNYFYDVGDNVKEGTVLFTVDSTDLNNNLRSLQANYKVAELGMNNAKTTFENNKLLFDEGIISETEYDQVKYAYESAQAQLEAIQVQMDTVNKSISDCSVKAPLTGVVTARNVERGGTAGQTAAYEVMDISKIKVEVGVSEQTINTVKVGDKVEVLMTSISAEPLTGTVATTSPAVGQTGTYSVTVEMDNKDGKIKAGMMAEVRFTAESAEDAIVLPRNTVIEKDDETYVYIVEGDKAKKVNVTIGIDTGENIEIVSGLKNGDTVVTKGQTYISDGETVTVSNAEKTTAKKETKETKTTKTKEKGE